MSELVKESIIGKVDAIIRDAIVKTASDIHIESTDQGARLRYRIDGVLYDQPLIDKSISNQIISRIKVLATIDIAEKRVPQDGKFIISNNEASIDLRVSTFPSIYGQKVVIRILDRSKNMIQLDTLGFSKSMLHRFMELIQKPSGFLLVTGPTGSGKTSTLYAALSFLNSPKKNIITLEDPVEYNLDGITQGQIHKDAGFTFERGIRALLRQDPDIAMIGEIRDKESAQIAIQAALTGHLVFSTLHTNDSPGAIMRLMDMQIEPFLINAALTGVLAQRLARKICPACKVSKVPSDDQKRMIDKWGIKMEILYEGEGCTDCFGLGYKGRIGIFELLVVSNQLRSLIIDNPIFEQIHAQAQRDGLKTLDLDGVDKVKRGLISLDELTRIIF